VVAIVMSSLIAEATVSVTSLQSVRVIWGHGDVRCGIQNSREAFPASEVKAEPCRDLIWVGLLKISGIYK
jgi:hypothetical protein